jgi:hypothetical protein
MCTTFRQFIKLAELSNIKLFIETASSTPDGENLKFLWVRAFKERLRVGHQLHVGAVEKLNDAHNKGYKEGYGEGRRDKETDWMCEGHGGFCSPLQVHQDSGTQTKPPSLVDTSASTSNMDTTVNEPTPTQINPPLPALVITVSSSTQTQDDIDNSPPLLPVPSTSTVELNPPPETEPHPQPLPAHLDWADNAALLPILPSRPSPP